MWYGSNLYWIAISATILKGLIYEIDDCNHKFNVTITDKESTVRNLKIESSSGQLHILCNSKSILG